jgi:2-dehydropantoate 2-reductase
MKFAVLGTGAVGGYYGGRLVEGGEDVHFLCRSNFERLAREPLVVRSIAGDFTAPLRVYRSLGEMPKVDVAFVTVKSSSTSAVAARLSSILHDRSAVVCLQNGLGNEEALAEAVGADRVIAGTVFICSEEVAPGVIEHTASGGARLGVFGAPLRDGAPTPETIAAVFERCGVKCGVDASGRRIKWRKLVWNIPFNGLSVYYGGVTTDVILADPEKRAFAVKLMEETIAAAAADGAALAEGLVEEQLRATGPMGAYRTSMMVDYMAGRKIELETILEEPLRRGSAGGLALPAMEELVRGVREKVNVERYAKE